MKCKQNQKIHNLVKLIIKKLRMYDTKHSNKQQTYDHNTQVLYNFKR